MSSGEFNKTNKKPKALTVAKKPGLIADAVEDLLQRSAPEVVIKSSITKEDREGITRALQPGDLAILITYALMTEEEAKIHRPTIVLMGDDNEIESVENPKA